MRELEFLPSWYSRHRRNGRLMMAQAWVTLLMAAAAVAWLWSAHRSAEKAEAALAVLDQRLVSAREQLGELSRLTVLQQEWQKKAEVLGRLGLHVDSARLLGRLAEALPESIALETLSFDVEEVPAPLSPAQRAALKDPSAIPMDRRLRVRLQGIAPTDVELATFLAELNRVSFLQQVMPSYARDHRAADRTLREFEVTFCIDLNGSAGS